jgi:hypothetical protein
MVGHVPMKARAEQKLRHEINTAKALFEHLGPALRRQPEWRRLLTSYRRAIDETQALMHRQGVAAACTVCATEGPGSCCFEGIETGYDRILLLINLLMGCSLPDSREAPESCFFVGEQGCRLRGRYYYCLHYLCPALQTSLGSDPREQLRITVAKELAAGWELEQKLREWLRKEAAAPLMTFSS